MSAASTSLDDDGGSTTSSEGGGYLGVTGGKSLTPSHPHLGGKTMVGGKTIKSMGNSTDDDSDLDEEENQNEEISYEAEVEGEEPENDDDEEEEEEQSVEVDDEETEDEDDTFQQPKAPPPLKIPKINIEPKRTFAPQTIQGGDDSQQSQLEAWKEVHASLTKAVLVAREAIASKKLQRRFWLETICANLSHPDEVKTAGMSANPSFMPLLMSHSVWFKPDQRKKKRGSKKREQEAEDTPKAAKKARKTKATAIPNKTTLASLSGTTKKKVAKGSALLKKRKIAMLPLKGKAKAAAIMGKPATKKKRATAALPTKKAAGLAGSTSKPKIRLNMNSSKTIPPEAMAAAPAVLSVFADSDDESDDGQDLAVAVAYANLAKEEDESDGDDADEKPTFSFNADDDTSSEEENDEDLVEAEIEDSGGDNNMETGQDDVPNEANSSDNDGHDWNASSSHPFLKKRRSSIQNVGSAQGNLDSSEIYSTFRAGADNEREETKNEAEAEAPSRMMVGGYGPFGGSDSSEDEIPF